MDLTEVLRAVAEHGETESGKGHGVGCVCMDNAARQVRKMIMDAITPARKREFTREEICLAHGDCDPYPDTWAYEDGELDREWQQKARIRNVIRMATNQL